MDVGNYRLSHEPSPAAKQPFAVVNRMANDVFAAYDCMFVMMKVAQIAGDQELGRRFDLYCSGAAVPYLPTAVITLKNTVEKIQAEGWKTRHVFAFTHDLFDASAAACYSYAFLSRGGETAGAAGTLLTLVADAGEVGVFATDYLQAKSLHDYVKAKGSADMHEAVVAKTNYSALRAFKSLGATIVGFFASHTLLTGACLIAPVAALALALVSQMANVAAFYTKNISSHILSIEYAVL